MGIVLGVDSFLVVKYKLDEWNPITYCLTCLYSGMDAP